MPANKAYLSKKLKKDLMRYIAAAGESYTRYEEWCDSLQIPSERRFTYYYFRNWCHRHRDEINYFKNLRDEQIRQFSTLDKESRVRELESDIDRINAILRSETVNGDFIVHECSKCGEFHDALDPNIVIKLIEQKRRDMETLSKERNEWMKADATVNSTSSPVSVARDSALRKLQRPQEEEVIDGEINVGLDENPI